jgi:ATP-binding cassette, subfamily C, bacterial
VGSTKSLLAHLCQVVRRGRVKTPLLLQMEAVECGAAALGIILEYYGRIVPLAELRRACGVSRDGSKASHILQAARGYGLEAKAFSVELNTLWNFQPPYIVFWNFSHYVVVEGVRRGRVYLNDPATGPRTVSLEEFDQAFTGVVLATEPGLDFKQGGRKPSAIQSLYARLKGSRKALGYCLIAGLCLVLPGLALPVFTQIFVDQVLIGDMQDWMRPLLLGMLLTAGFRGLLMLLQLHALRRLKLKLTAVMSGQFVWHLLYLPVEFYAQRYAGEISHRTALNDKTADVLSSKLVTTMIDISMMLVYAAVMLQYDVMLTLIGLSCAGCNMVALQWISRRRIEANMHVLQESGRADGVAIAGLRNIEMLKASSLESDFFARWAGYYAKSMKAQQELGVTNQTLSVLPSFLTALTSMLVLGIGGLRVMDGYLTIGMLVAFQSLMQSFLAPITRLVDLGGTLQELRGDLYRLDDVLSNPSRRWSDGGHVPVTPRTFRLQGAIEVRQVTFGHSQVLPPVVDQVSLSLQPGQRVALVGASGSGKSTLAKLVCGLHEPWTGDIRFDGASRDQIPSQVLAHSVAMVDQDIVFFPGTIRDNLTLWDSTVTDAQLVQACKDAAIHDDIVSMAGGYDSELLEGAANLSGGQRQRLEIARALVGNPAILVMDEATSALDAETEYLVVEHIRRRGCTCLIVAHRLSTIRDCDDIIVLDQGRVVQQGTHKALVQQGGIYTRLLRDEPVTLTSRANARTEAA